MTPICSVEPAADGDGFVRKIAFDRRDWAICGLLLLAVVAVFGRTVGYDFVNFDDNYYIYENPIVSKGLSVPGLHWAFCESHDLAWVPLTWISFMLDSSLHGGNAGGFHLTNVLLHAATVVVLFLVLRQMTGRRWPSALAAVLFAIHPLRVESVAWVTERKDVLSGLFFMLTLAAYLGYARRHSRRRYAFYAVMTVLFTLGLLAKQMLVTLPFVLLLLDWWPLGRIRLGDEETGRRGDAPTLPQIPKRESPSIPVSQYPRLPVLFHLLLEKLPLFALSAAASVAAFQASYLAHTPHANFTIGWRVGNALIAYATYLKQSLYPADLVVIRSLSDAALSPWAVGGSAVLLAAITVAAWLGRRKYPYLAVGWLWYLGMLVPVLGIVQYGLVSVSDRFTYLPQIGLCIAVSWGAADFCAARPHYRRACVAGALAAVFILTVCAFHQTSYWRDSLTLWQRALDCTEDNYVAELNLGVALESLNRRDDAKPHLEKAMKLRSEQNIRNAFYDASKYGKELDKTLERYWKNAAPSKGGPLIPEDEP